MECKDLEGNTISSASRSDFLQMPVHAWSALYLQFATASSNVNDGCFASPEPKDGHDEDLSLINAAVDESPHALSETYQESGPYASPVRKNTATRFRQRKAFASLSFPAPAKRLHTRMHKWRMFSGSSPKKHLQQGLRIVKSKTRGVASKTRGAASKISSLPEIGGLARASARKSVSEMVRRAQVRAQASHVSETAQKRFGYIKERAVNASLAISDRVSETAKKGIQMARELARTGGA